MHYFLVQEDNQLIHLSDCRFEEGEREKREVYQFGGPSFFADGRKLPDIFTFTIPRGASTNPCFIVDEDAIVHRVLVSRTEIRANIFMAAGVVEEKFEAPNLIEARAGIAEAIRNIKE